jgi:hypothetical protein
MRPLSIPFLLETRARWEDTGELYSSEPRSQLEAHKVVRSIGTGDQLVGSMPKNAGGFS